MKKIAYLLLFVSYSVLSQTIDTQKLNNYFSALEKNDKFMGSVALYKNGKIVYHKAIGFIDIETKTKPNKGTKYRIGSISKTFTATLLMKAVEENKISLNDKLSAFFPEIKNAEKITIENLLNHRSGIHNFTNDAAYMRYNTQSKTRQQMLDILTKLGNDFEPNEKSDYSNSNYVLLSYILEDIYKQPFATILQEKIVKPLGLQNTFLGGKINNNNNEANSYRYIGGWSKQNETNTSIPLGAGGIVSTSIEITLFAKALFNGKIITKKSAEKMKKIVGKYGYGLFQIPFNSKISYGHTGGIDGFSSVFSYFEEDDVAFALISNGTNYVNNNISIVLLRAVYGLPFDVPSFKSYNVSNEDLEKYVGVYASKQIPLKVTITSKEGKLIAQATGQSSFPLEATNEHTFKFDAAGIVLKFVIDKNQMILNQGGGSFTFTKE